GHFRALLEGMAHDPGRRVGDIPLLGAVERRQLLTAWSAPRRGGEELPPVHRGFEAQAARTPDSPAVDGAGLPLTYAELNARANRLARRLRALGVGTGTRVGVCLERTPELVTALLAVLKAGGAYVPVDLAYPAERIAFMLADARVPVLLTLESLRERLPEHDARVLRLDADAAEIDAEDPSDLEGAAAGTDLAYMIYTSGSTGRPKAVMVEHRNLAQVLRASRERFRFDADVVMPCIASVAFDIAGFEILNPLLAGGTCVMLDREQVLDLPSLVGELERFNAVHAVPSLMGQLLREVRAQGIDPARFDRFRLVFTGGDAVPPELLAEIRAVFREAEVHVLYGPTEATIIAVTYEVPRGERVDRRLIGTPLPHVSVRLLDRRGELVPVGVPGELHLGGPGVTRGYWGREELSREKFLEEDGERWYRTGDVARWLPSGQFEFIGRVDHQVKVRGFRIELGEVESTLARHPSVKECVVALLGEDPDDRRLVAYVVPHADRVPTVDELRRHLGKQLPDYMVPSAFVVLPELPLSPTGKVDRRALPVPDAARPELETRYVAPRTPTEQALAAVWREVLGVERVGVEDNFFALGGHSLLATQVVSRVREGMKADLPLRALFEAPTVAALAERMERAETAAPAAAAPVLESTEREGEVPLSFAQQRLWFLEQMHPGTTAYSLPSALRLTGPLDAGALERAIGEIVRRHESLRTVFAATAGRPRQAVSPPRPFRLAVSDLSPSPPAEREARVAQLCADDAQRPFDLARGPLFRASLLRLDAADHVLLLNFHHIVTDGWSMGVFMRELAALYGAFTHGEPSPLPELPIQYADYALWQARSLAGDGLGKLVEYWKARMADPPTLQLPTDHPRPLVPTSRGAQLPVALPAALGPELAALSRREGCTLFMTLLAAFQVLLARYSGQEDVVVGTPIANRTLERTEGLIGFFANTLALRADLAGDPAFRELLARVRESTLDAYAHQDLPFEQVVDAVQPERDLGRHPLFQVQLVLQNTPGGGGPELPGLELRPVGVDTGAAKFDLTLFLTETPGGLTGSLEYNADLFEADTVRRMAGHFQALLEGIVRDPAQRVGDLPVLGAAERRQLLVAWNATAAPVPGEPLVHRAFEAQAARTPDSPAVMLAGTDLSLTYAELNARANRLARRLRALGVGTETRVGVCLERTPELVTALLAVLKAGGAYVPVDLAYPAERIAFMLA
ncbi:MAG TPA: amino acid adenylation domain-containing protein, partial [Longimicrobiaceae bacterium]